ncbi:hypothetical protein K1T35_48165 (plasmid) [Pseudonocardia sp. DSM 110487]|uniref:hypothetical protein n=1 Tax=Pseudonocardia sp. DSM 110487 TaxID=2865833 RepID=UPI001C69C20D|nr:hypothetical protein [Pseudonocardia sp. DSM 110487]QYN41125.1 hypothetical protein K1T35_48165 [Pseudonocardia sp. DSM 110487]
MTTAARDRIHTTVLSGVGGLAGHYGGDYLVQLHRWAAPSGPDGVPLKQQHNPQGRRALAAHVISYVATQAVTKAAFYRSAGVRVPLLAQLSGAVVEGVLHAAIDDGRLLRRFADATGKRRFHDLAAGGINGRALLDQAAHLQIQIPAGTFVTAAVACAITRRRNRRSQS